VSTPLPPIHELGTILGVWAHPDDEAYLSAGLMALARRTGQRVVVVHATDGDASGDGDPRANARLRRAELRASLSALDVTEAVRLGFRDGACDIVPLGIGAGAVRSVIERIAPTTIVTFGPDGLTGHADHQAVSAWVDAALDAVAVADATSPRLLHVTLADEFHARWGQLCDEVGIWMGPERPSTPLDECALVVQCEGDVLEQKMDALRAHRSQTTGLVQHVGEATYRQWWAKEYYVDAPERATRRRDLARTA
jgi:LmbE family N-acetylglucosaminyl deacetylase